MTVKEEDKKLLERLYVLQDTLHQRYGSINSSQALNAAPQVTQDVHLQILSFENIIKECQAQVMNNTLEEIEDTLKLVYHIDLKKNGSKDAIKKLNEIADIYLSSKKEDQNIDEHLLEDYRQDLKLVDAALTAISLREDYYAYEGIKRIFIPKKLLKQYQSIKEDLEALRENMRGCYQLMHNLVTEHIVESFHYIYLYFLYIISYFRAKNDEMIILEIVAILDRFIDIMKPLSESINLKQEHLRNSYVIYELSLLKEELLSLYK